jgi:hypothetical protein
MMPWPTSGPLPSNSVPLLLGPRFPQGRLDGSHLVTWSAIRAVHPLDVLHRLSDETKVRGELPADRVTIHLASIPILIALEVFREILDVPVCVIVAAAAQASSPSS